MEWSQLFLKKEEWQRNTFNRIKNELISAKDNRFIRYDNSEENHLVMIYGKSQVGKTTLILNMIGIKDEYFHEVYETLRAGVPRGNSSTSTAIIYSKSNNHQYGCALSSISDLATKNVRYYDKLGMIDQLVKIRKDVESNRANAERVLFIYIPKDYFINDSTVNNISILDMPGVESRNHREDIHVQNLMTKYIPISSVCIIACRSNEIQSLETTVLPNQMDWKRMSHRFILVITHAYNDGTTKSYFKIAPLERKKSFYEYVSSAYTQEIRKILGKNNQTEVYPIDVGDTLLRLCTDEIQTQSDRNEIIATKDKILSDIRQSIVNRKGERLKSALIDLEIIVSHYGEDEIHSILKNISEYNEKIENRNKLIKRTESYIEQLNGEDSEKDEFESDVTILESIKKQISNLTNRNIDNIDTLFSQTEQYILSHQLYKESSKGKYLKDKEESVINNMQTVVLDSAEKIVNILLKLIEQANPYMSRDIYIKKTEILLQINNTVGAKRFELYPPKKGVFSKKEKVFFEGICSICDSIQSDINDIIHSCEQKINTLIEDAISEKRIEIYRINQTISNQQSKIQKYNTEIDKLKQIITKLEIEQETIKKKKQQDRETLAMYLKYANQAYLEQRNNIVRQINSSCSPDEKFMLILFLGLLDKDYQKVTGGINENSYQYADSK